MQPLALPGVWTWSRWQADRQMPFSSYLLVSDGGNVAFDPLPLDESETAEIGRLGGIATILLTNRDHGRGAAEARERFGARILAGSIEAPLFDLRLDGVFDPSSELDGGITPVALDGAKTPGEVAFLLKHLRAAVVGDALLGSPAGALTFLPETKLGDSRALLRSLRRLRQERLDALLLGDGVPVLAGADELLGAFLETRGGPDVNRINVDELQWRHADRGDGTYECDRAEIGLPIGARRLGYQLVRLPPGRRFCPLHDHDREEEMFYVLDGAPTIRTQRGTIELRAGDFIAFPVGPRGAHQLLNAGDRECTLLLLGANDPDEVCYYPDSDKFLIERRDRVVRGAGVEYYEGE